MSEGGQLGKIAASHNQLALTILEQRAVFEADRGSRLGARNQDIDGEFAWLQQARDRLPLASVEIIGH